MRLGCGRRTVARDVPDRAGIRHAVAAFTLGGLGGRAVKRVSRNSLRLNDMQCGKYSPWVGY